MDRGLLLVCHTVIALGCYSIGSDFFGVTHFESAGGRYFGALGDGVAWALTIPLVVYFSAGRFPLAALAALALALTGSRAPALTVMFALLLMLAFSRGRRFQYAAMIASLVVVSLYQAGIFATVLKRFSATEFLANDRTTTAATGLAIFAKSPVFGSGYNAMNYLYPTTARLRDLGILPMQTSTFVQMLSDGGLLTFLPYVGFVVAATATGISLMRNSRALPDGAVLNGVAAWVIAMLWVNQSALWFVVGSYVGPLVLALVGVVAGTHVRVRSTLRMRELHTATAPPREMVRSRRASRPLAVPARR